jgi:hypothetical protein
MATPEVIKQPVGSELDCIVGLQADACCTVPAVIQYFDPTTIAEAAHSLTYRALQFARSPGWRK